MADKLSNQHFESRPRQLIQRHWLLFFCGEASGILWALFLVDTAALTIAVVFLLCCALYFYPGLLPGRRLVIWFLLFFAFGNLLVVFHGLPRKADKLHELALSYPRGMMEFEGTVSDTSPFLSGRTAYSTCVLHVDTLVKDKASMPLSGKAVLRWSEPSCALFNGSRVRVIGRLSPHLSTVNYGVTDSEDRRRRQGVFSGIHTRNGQVQIIHDPGFTLAGMASRLRQSQAEHLVKTVPEEVFPFVLGIWLGDRSLITDETYQIFAWSGTAHVLAVSGLHVGVIALTFPFLCRLLRLRKRYTLLCSMAGILLFTLMTGAHISVIRASLMMLLYYLYQLLRREPDTISVLSLSGVIFLTIQPHVILDIAFLLSFGSVSSLLLFYPGILARLQNLPRFLSSACAVTLASQVITVPIIAWSFFTVSLTGIAANLLVVPLLIPVLWLSMATGILAPISSTLALLPGHALLPLVSLIQWVNRAALLLPVSFLYVNRPTLCALGFYCLFLIFFYLVLYEERKQRRNRLLCILCVCACLVFWRPWTAPALVDFLDVGRGDSSFVRTPGGTSLLIDAGDSDGHTDAGKRMIVPYLRANRISHLDYLVISHADRDHIGGAFYVLNHFPVKKVVLGAVRDDYNALESNLIALCAQKNIPVLHLSRGDFLPAEKASVEVLHPPLHNTDNLSRNDGSLVLAVAFDGIRILFAADIEEAGEKEIQPCIQTPFDVLKVAHHGSPTSSRIEFLDAVRPSLAVVSAHRAGSRGTLMTPAMAERFEARKITLLRTDWHGAIRLQADRKNGGYKVSTARESRGYSLQPVE